MRRPARHDLATRTLATVALFALAAGDSAKAQEPVAAPSGQIALRDALVIGRVGQYGRAPVHRDALEAQIVSGRWSPPKAGDTVSLPDGSTRTWETASAAEDGWITHDALRAGYAYVSVEVDAERVMILEATAHSLVYVNGRPRAGDPYRTNKVRLPVLLRAGSNDFLFACRRGCLLAKLTMPASAVLLDTRDATLPDLIIGENVQARGAVVVVNASTEVQDNLQIEAIDGDAKPGRTSLPSIPPLSIRKVGFQLKGPGPTEPETRTVELRLVRLTDGKGETLDTASIELRVRRPEEKHKRTFISDIDGSVQYYAVTPAQRAEDDDEPPALFLTLHGAGVEATGQANAYSPKTWGHIVAPTNRRHFGFDWEDWGRLDALEVLELVQKRFGTDPRRTYLTGHSMGGHGVWHVGVTFPDRFAAIGPSAGWISFWSYAGAARYEDATPMEQMLMRATAPSDTLSLSRNYLHHGVYILHGEKDDNVPVEQARTMRAHLAEFHADFAYYERPGAGHWWDGSAAPGTDCVDWPPMFDFFKQHVAPEADAVRHVEFVTASPGASTSSHWVTIEAQIEQLKPSKVDMRFDPDARRFVGSTENVARLSIDLEHVEAGPAIQMELDGQEIEDIVSPTGTDRVWLAREGESWSNVGIPAADLKGPQRYGPFKEAFRNRVIFVYGTAGKPEENTWAFAKARYDAETFWYRGNASIDVIPDTAFDSAAEPDRNVILYGNAQTNAVWGTLLADSPVQVRRGLIRIGERELVGDDLGCLFVRPRPGSDRALVGVVTGSGLPGMRLTERLPYFVSGIAYPDCIVLGPEVLAEGTVGVRAAGFFGLDWTVTNGEFAYQY
jgi:poly(3-hydroxybutyrate) depolymerase